MCSEARADALRLLTARYLNHAQGGPSDRYARTMLSLSGKLALSSRNGGLRDSGDAIQVGLLARCHYNLDLRDLLLGRERDKKGEGGGREKEGLRKHRRMTRRRHSRVYSFSQDRRQNAAPMQVFHAATP